MRPTFIFGRDIIDSNVIEQIKRCIQREDDIAVLTADAHKGYSHPIGGAVAYKDRISIAGVGYDIACGNMAVRTEIPAREIPKAIVMDDIFSQISFGVGQYNNERIEHPVIDKVSSSEFSPLRRLSRLAQAQLGTVGAGNHFVDLFEDESGALWIGVHFGSRGFGHKTATGFLALAQGKKFTEKPDSVSEDAPPVLIDTKSDLGEAYIFAMHLAGEYAYAGREAVVNKVLQILGNPRVTYQVHNHHNFAWKEEHFGEMYWVVRKGCTPAFPGQAGFIGSNMMDTSVVVEGVDSEVSRQGLYSTVHGAGRVMSRNEAAGKKKWLRGEDGKKRPVRVNQGKVDFKEVQRKLQEQGIELRGGAADEAPQCYKSLTEVLKYHEGTVEVKYRLRPIGVAMAGADTFDPYKD